MMNATTFGQMKRGSYFVNAARGELVDEAAMLAALSSGHLAGAGIDVARLHSPRSPLDASWYDTVSCWVCPAPLPLQMEVEPGTPESLAALRACPTLFMTPHVGSGTFRAKRAMCDLLCDNLKEVTGRGGLPLTPVNQPRDPKIGAKL